jgi:hypothetical protein
VYDEAKKKLCPNLGPNNSEKTSDSTIDYNCMAWVMGVKDKWMDHWNYFQATFGFDPNTADHTAIGYADILVKHYGFEHCDDDEYEEGFDKVALYENNIGEWSHIAIRLKDGKWSSKLGDLEDITHDNLDVIAGGVYGHPVLYMKRPKANNAVIT